MGFYRRFIKDFSRISKAFTFLSAKHTPFIFSDNYLEAFYKIKEALIIFPIIQLPNWSLPFEIICYASNYVVRAVLGKRRDKKSYVIDYASKTLDEAQ